MSRLTLAEVDQIRNTPGRSVLLFLTDRCPVGCAHCSVDSRPDSPTIRDYQRFSEILDGLCAQPNLTTIGISGGEPFVERRGLTLAAERLVGAGKQLVLYTSGIWATIEPPTWAREVVRQASCVFLSTDAFHAPSIGDERFARAARTIVDEGVWLIVQVIDRPEMVREAERLLQLAFGSPWRAWAELSLTPALPYGRGESVFHRTSTQPGQQFGRCGALAAPVVRYDGVVTACCNEQIIARLGPDRLRQQVSTGDELGAALARFDQDPVLKVIGRVGAGVLTHQEPFAQLASQEFSSICELCWRMQERAQPVGEPSNPATVALASLAPRTAM